MALIAASAVNMLHESRRKKVSPVRTPSAPIARTDIPDKAFKGLGEVLTEAGRTGKDEFLFRQSVSYPDGKTRVLKTVFDNKHAQYLHPRGQFVLYEHFRTDGTRAMERLVYPEKQLAAGVIATHAETTFAADGRTEIESRYFRENGTLAKVFDQTTSTATEYRSDGTTLRSIQTNINQESVLKYLRLDGTTLWWEYNFDRQSGRVYFDLNGEPYAKTFQRHSLLKNGYSLGPNSPQIPTHQDSYLREDGSVEYRQTWAVCWDQTIWSSRDVLTGLEIFGADGKLLDKITIEAGSATPPGVDERMLQGFNVNARAVDDDDSFDL